MSQNELDAIEAILDRHDLATVLAGLADLCYLKGQQMLDDRSARECRRMGLIIDEASAHAANIEI